MEKKNQQVTCPTCSYIVNKDEIIGTRCINCINYTIWYLKETGNESDQEKETLWE